MSEIDYQQEAVKTVNNLCLISLLLIDADRRELLPTVLELMHQETQGIIDDYCIAGELD